MTSSRFDPGSTSVRPQKPWTSPFYGSMNGPGLKTLCIPTLFSIYLLFLNCFGVFLIVFLSLPFFLFTLVVSMAPKRKSAPSQNPLRSKASSSSDPTPSHIRFRDEDARKDFSEKFSWRGVHLERQVILADFTDTDLPTVIHNRGWESLCDVPVTCLTMLI